MSENLARELELFAAALRLPTVGVIGRYPELARAYLTEVDSPR